MCGVLWCQGAWYEYVGLSHVLDELRSLRVWRSGESLPPPGHTLLSLTQRSTAALSDVFRPSTDLVALGGDQVRLSVVPAADWLGPSFVSLLPAFMELQPWCVDALLDMYQEYGGALFRYTRFLSRINWQAVDRAEIVSSRQPIYSLPTHSIRRKHEADNTRSRTRRSHAR